MGLRLTAALRKSLRDACCVRDETAQSVIAKSSHVTSTDTSEASRLHGRVLVDVAGRYFINEYEPDPELRDTEQIPLTEPGGVDGFMAREVWPYAPDAWVAEGSERIGYEISFTRYFYKPQQLRTLAEIEADIRALEAETEGLLDDILVTVGDQEAVGVEA